jgi:hypothetical protein
MLMRRYKVEASLDWLKLNHAGYKDLEISRANLDSYPENGTPASVYPEVKLYDPGHDWAILPLAMSVHDDGDEHGTTHGPCTFAVHRLSSADYPKSVALRHCLTDKGDMLGI